MADKTEGQAINIAIRVTQMDAANWIEQAVQMERPPEQWTESRG